MSKRSQAPKKERSNPTVVDVDDLSFSAAGFDAGGRLVALGGWGGAKVLRFDDTSEVWSGEVVSVDADPEDAGVVVAATVASSGRQAFFATDFHTGATGSKGLFVVDLTSGDTAELEQHEDDEDDAYIGAAFTADDARVVIVTHRNLIVHERVGGAMRRVALPWASENPWARIVETTILMRDATHAVLVAGRHLFDVDLVRGEAERLAVVPTDETAQALGGVAVLTARGSIVLAGTAGAACGKVWRLRNGELVEGPVVRGVPFAISADGARIRSIDPNDGGALLETDLATKIERVLARPRSLPAKLEIAASAVGGARVVASSPVGNMVSEVFLTSLEP